MTTAKAPAEASTPDMDLVRERRDRTGAYRLYVGDILIGRLDLVRTRNLSERYHVEGTRCSRWRGTPTRVAWTLNRIGAPVPAADLLAPLPADRPTRPAAARALVEHLRAHDAAGVAPLYGADHA